MAVTAVSVDSLRHRYGEREALRGVTFEVTSGQIFGLLGPNGSGKTTLFRVLTTLLPLQQGAAAIGGHDVKHEPDQVRRQIGVTFQSPSLDVKLSVRENLMHQGHLYGISGTELKSRIEAALSKLSLTDRARDYVETLSGGLKRRVEIAKCLLHSPSVLLLDEPSTGLDPGARHELWSVLEQLRQQEQMTVLVTTHLMEEAERCDRLVILDEGRLIADGSPDELRSSIGGDCITIEAPHPDVLAGQIEQRLGVQVQRMGSKLRIEHAAGDRFISELVSGFPGEFRSVMLGKPTLNDVFIRLTGRHLEEANQGIKAAPAAH